MIYVTGVILWYINLTFTLDIQLPTDQTLTKNVKKISMLCLFTSHCALCWMFFGPAIWINSFAIFWYISVSTVDLLGPSQCKINLSFSSFSFLLFFFSLLFALFSDFLVFTLPRNWVLVSHDFELAYLWGLLICFCLTKNPCRVASTGLLLGKNAVFNINSNIVIHLHHFHRNNLLNHDISKFCHHWPQAWCVSWSLTASFGVISRWPF